LKIIRKEILKYVLENKELLDAIFNKKKHQNEQPKIIPSAGMIELDQMVQDKKNRDFEVINNGSMFYRSKKAKPDMLKERLECEFTILNSNISQDVNTDVFKNIDYFSPCPSLNDSDLSIIERVVERKEREMILENNNYEQKINKERKINKK